MYVRAHTYMHVRRDGFVLRVSWRHVSVDEVLLLLVPL